MRMDEGKIYLTGQGAAFNFFRAMLLGTLFLAVLSPSLLFCQTLSLTAQEEKWLAKHSDSLILAPTPNYPPIDFFDETGRHTGIGGDVSRLIENILNIRFQRKQLPTWGAILKEAKAGRIALTTIAQRTPKRDEFWLFTEPYITAPTVILSRIEQKQDLSLGDMQNLKVGMVKGYAIDEYLEESFPELKIIAVKDDQTGLEKLSMGELDAMIADLPTAGYLISKRSIGNLRVAGQTGHSYNYSIAVNKKHPILRDILNKALASISTEKHAAINSKWFKVDLKPFYEEQRFWLVIISVLIILGAIILIVMILNHSLKNIVEKRTRDLKLAHEKLRQAEKINAIGQLAGGIAHDFNNQLTGIMGFAELLTAKLEDPKLKNFALQISETAARAADLTGQLLAFSRKGKYLNVPTDIHLLIEEVEKILQRSIDKQIVIKNDLGAEPSMIQGDPTQLQNAILNLALNARDAMPQGGELLFATRIRNFSQHDPTEELAQGHYIQISVSDTGTGMDKETQQHLFEPFFTTKEVGKGTGLGLPSVYGTVKNHGGTIRVYSEPGKGSTFKLYLPLQFKRKSRQEQQKSPPVMIKGNAENILVVDDEPTILEVVKEMLQELGYKPMTCQNPIIAIDIYKSEWQKIDLVILDMVMPVKSGKELFKALKAVNPDIKAILASGFTINGEAQKILDLGVLSFVQKPFSKYEIAGALAKALSNQEQ